MVRPGPLGLAGGLSAPGEAGEALVVFVVTELGLDRARLPGVEFATLPGGEPLGHLPCHLGPRAHLLGVDLVGRVTTLI